MSAAAEGHAIIAAMSAEAEGDAGPVVAGSFGYSAARALVRFLLAVFYRRVDAVGLEHVPKTGGLIVAANHHNSVVDAMVLVAVVPRRLRTLANAPLFSNPLIGPFLRLLGALPVHRREEAGNDPSRNASLFAATTATLRNGGAIAIFPEGKTQPEPVLLELRTGAARMLLAAEDGGAGPVALLPVGLVFDEPGTFREGRALVLVGPPVAMESARAVAAAEPERAARVVTDELARALRALIVEAPDRVTLRLLGTVEALWREEGGDAPADGAARVAWLQRAMRTYRTLLERDRARVDAFRAALEELASDAERAGLPGSGPERMPTASRLASRAASLIVLAPLALAGIALHVIPYRLTGRLVRALKRTDEEEATDKIAAGLLLFPVTWAVEAWVAWRLGGVWAAAGLCLAFVPTGLLAVGWHERLQRLAADLRAFSVCRHDAGLVARLQARRRDLAAELRSLARLVPEEWPESGGHR